MFLIKDKTNNKAELINKEIIQEEINDFENVKVFINWGKLKDLIEDDNITDIKCNSHTVWYKHVKKGTHKANFNLEEEEIEQIAYQISNHEGSQFNHTSPSLKADYDDLRLQVQHNSICPSGINMTIRKTPFIQRIKPSQVEETGYCSNLLMSFFKEAVKERMGVVAGGETGSGKTEFIKVLCSFIPDEQGIITIEDTSELHLAILNPNRNIIELKLNDYFNFDNANNDSMRMDPDWVLLSEARGKEISKLIACRSEGHGILTTLHLKNSTSLVERIVNMYDPVDRPADYLIENMIYEYFDMCVHITCDISKNATKRFIDEVTLYYRTKGTNTMATIYERNKKGETVYHTLPTYFKNIVSDELLESWEKNVEK
ncbi:MAG: ATPase, T2SS/T4P/T4SS family [Erysipelotrichaceae bacterium]